MKLVVFGLSISSAWGNGHATLLRGLFRELYSMGHQVDFLELDVPYYAAHRDASHFDFVNLHLYSDWQACREEIKRLLSAADVGMITSYCPDAVPASELILGRSGLRKVFYDMDTPVTLNRLARGESVSYLPAGGLGGFDLVLSYTGGDALRQLQLQLGARRVASLYGWVDPATHVHVPSIGEYTCDMSYLGTYAADRQEPLQQLLLRPAAQLLTRRFIVAGAMYKDVGRWPQNVHHIDHVAPALHSAFYSSSALTLSVTRGAMAEMGYCPSGRLFEAAACGTAVLSDWWEGLDTFFEPGKEILIGRSTMDALDAINSSPGLLLEIGARAREKVLACHTAAARAKRFVELVGGSPENEVRSNPGELACAGS